VPRLRPLLRLVPLLAGALAAGLRQRRRSVERARLPAPAPRPEAEPARAHSVGSEDERVDIVTIVDDLLLIGR
jgi:hypothetical protein